MLATDGLLAAVVGVLAIAGSTQASEHVGELAGVVPFTPLGPLAYVLMAVAAAALVVRRFWPLVVLAVVVVAVAAYLAGGYVFGPSLLPVAVAAYTLGAHRPVRTSLIACGLAVVAFLAGHAVAMGPGWLLFSLPTTAPWSMAWTGLPWAVGTVLRLRREQVVHARDEAARHRVEEERLRIVREVHDVVGHSLSAINMQSGIALHVLDKRPEQAQTALDAIRQTSKDALDELRGTLAVFREPDGAGAERHPAPGLDQLDALAASMRRSGLRVEVNFDGTPPDLPAAVNLAAYRIVQESLTNVLRHAGPASATVRIRHHSDSVDVTITDDGRGARYGLEAELRPEYHRAGLG